MQPYMVPVSPFRKRGGWQTHAHGHSRGVIVCDEDRSQTHARPLMLALKSLGFMSAIPGAHAPHCGVRIWLFGPVASFSLCTKHYGVRIWLFGPVASFSLCTHQLD